jgi:AcrR family transcriptional regulator
VSTSRPAQSASQVQRPGSTGLREQKRAVVRQALSGAALRLALERGLEQVLVADIAAEAGVSPRTFNNYFSSKEEAVVAPAFDRMAQVLVTFGKRPPSEPLWESVTQAILAQFPAPSRAGAETAGHARLVTDNAGLRAEQLKAYAAIERLLADAIAERLGADADADAEDLFPSLVAAAAIGASRAAFDHWLDGNHDVPFRSVLARALAQSGRGFTDSSGGNLR